MPRPDGRKDGVLVSTKGAMERSSSSIIRWFVPTTYSPLPHKTKSTASRGGGRKTSKLQGSSGWSLRRGKGRTGQGGSLDDRSLVVKLQQELHEAREQVSALKQQREAIVPVPSFDSQEHTDLELGSLPRTVSMDKSEIAAYNLAIAGTPTTTCPSEEMEVEPESHDKENMPVRTIRLEDHQLIPEDKTPLKPQSSNVQENQKPAKLFDAGHNERSQDPPTPSTTSFASWNTPPQRTKRKMIVICDNKSKLSLTGIPVILDEHPSMDKEEMRRTHRPAKLEMDKAIDDKVSRSGRPSRHGHDRRDKQATVRQSQQLVGDSTGVRDSPPTEVVAVHKTTVVPHVEDDRHVQRRLARSMLIAETYRCKLGKAETKISSLFRDLEEARRSVHTLVSRNMTLAAKLKAKNTECDETMIPRASVLKACVYMSPVFVICGGFEHYLLTIVLLWLLLELEAVKTLKQEDETITQIKPRDVRRSTNNTMIATIPEMIELRSVGAPESVLSV